MDVFPLLFNILGCSVTVKHFSAMYRTREVLCTYIGLALLEKFTTQRYYTRFRVRVRDSGRFRVRVTVS